MSIQKKSLINNLKSAKKANVVKEEVTASAATASPFKPLARKGTVSTRNVAIAARKPGLSARKPGLSARKPGLSARKGSVAPRMVV